MKTFLCSIALVAGLGSVQASASPVLFDLSDKSFVVLTSFEGWGGAPAFTPKLNSPDTLLHAGETWTIDLFSIAFPLIGSGNGTISALLGINILGPDAPIAPDVQNSAKGSFWSFILSAGDLTWNTKPAQYTLSDGTKYTVAFENLSGITLGRSVDVHAFLTLNTEPESVPEPGTIALLGLGMVGVMFASRRKLLSRTA